MTYNGKVKHGVIILEGGALLPAGQAVEVQPLEQLPEPPTGRTLYDRLKDIIGIAEGLPADIAENHDHYIHRTPRRTGK